MTVGTLRSAPVTLKGLETRSLLGQDINLTISQQTHKEVPMRSITCNFGLFAMIMTVIFLPCQSYSEDGHFSHEISKQALRSFIVPTAPPEALQAAIAGKKALSRVLKKNERHARDLGFSSAAEADDSKTELGEPFPFFFISVDKLKSYTEKTNPIPLLISSLQFIFPLNAVGFDNSLPLSSLTVARVPKRVDVNEEWRAIGWGAPKLIRFLVSAQQKGHASSSRFIVRIEELGRYFLGDLRDKELFIIPLIDEGTYGFVAGTPLSAEVAFLKLVQEAQRMYGLAHRNEPMRTGNSKTGRQP
jgi:hypothetical protein